MTYAEYRDQAMLSAELYFDYLKDTGKGLAETKVKSVEILGNGFVRLKLSGRLASTDDTQIKVFNQVYTADQVMPVRYDKDEKILIVRPRKEFLHIFHDCDAANVLVISDLKFLVRRVGDWYDKHPAAFSLPRVLPLPLFDLPELHDQPSEEQSEALNGILNEPVSYVWGAPGTGKTQFVLARAVLSYCRREECVLITAPTNNAVEQSLKGILAVLEEAGIPLEKVLRLGIPSEEFFNRYPTVCEIQSIERELAQIEKDISFCEKAKVFFASLAWYDEVSVTVSSVRNKLSEISHKSSILDETLKETENRLRFKKAMYAPASTHLYLKNEERDKLLKYIGKKRSGLLSLLCKGKIAKAKTELSKLDAQLSRLAKEYESLEAEIDGLTKQAESIKAEQRDLEAERLNAFFLLNSVPACPAKGFAFNSILETITADTIAESFSEYNRELFKLKDLLDKRTPCYDSHNPDDIENRLTSLRQRKESLSEQSVAARLPDCLVIAATVDGFIGKLSGSDAFKPVHIFLDEAAYCPLIKGITLLSVGAPLTMFGDHKQLPPVCEAPPGFISEHESVRMWERSALYMEDAFSLSVPALYKKLSLTDDMDFPISPKLNRIMEYDLHHTYRFGIALAAVLDRFVYRASFTGNPEIGTSIYYIHVPKKTVKGMPPHSNFDECLAVRELLSSHRFTDFAVLTPYKKALQLLVKYVDRDNVFTIHGSQGREWDTVILSVVETTKNWFLKTPLINTAVSRAKRNLIIVCDAEYWIKEKNHIIGGLLSAGSPY